MCALRDSGVRGSKHRLKAGNGSAPCMIIVTGASDGHRRLGEGSASGFHWAEKVRYYGASTLLKSNKSFNRLLLVKVGSSSPCRWKSGTGDQFSEIIERCPGEAAEATFRRRSNTLNITSGLNYDAS